MKYTINQSKFTAKHSKRVASKMNWNSYQMKYKNLEITIEGNTEERPFGLTHPIQKRKDQCG